MTDIANDRDTGVDAYAEADRPRQFVDELRIELFHIDGDQSGRLDCLAARLGRTIVKLSKSMSQ